MDYITKIERKMTKKNKSNYRKGQSFLEYSLLIAVAVGVLILMQHYMSRSLQGKLKESVDSLGSEHLSASFSIPLPESGTRVSPAGQSKQGRVDPFYTTSRAVRRSSTGFTYEGERGFVISTNAFRRTELGKIRGEVLPSMLPEGTEIEAGDSSVEVVMEQLENDVSGSPLDPGMEEVRASVEGDLPSWGQGSEVEEHTDVSPGTGEDSVVVDEGLGQMSAGEETEADVIASDADDIWDEHGPSDIDAEG